jgi:hypothetical protein
MVGALLTILTLGVLQVGFALLIRNTVVDAAAEGARYGALADNSPSDGARRTAELITVALGESYAGSIGATTGDYLGHRSVIVTVSAPLPLIGLIGIDHGVEVSGHAAIEEVAR